MLFNYTGACSSCFMHAIVARMRLPFFKILSSFVYFSPHFQIFSLFWPFFWKISHMPFLFRIGPVYNFMPLVSHILHIPPEKSENPWFSNVSKGYRNWPVTWNVSIHKALLLKTFKLCVAVKTNIIIINRSSHQRCSVKKDVLKISQYSQEKACVGVPF